MQWRLLLRRGPQRSFTVVGDVAQASAAAGATTWEHALEPFGADAWRLEELTVNYRTPAQIARAAEDMAIANGLVVTRSRSVRESEWPVDIRRVEDVREAVLTAIADERAIDDRGTIAVIASADQVDELHDLASARFHALVGRGAAGLSRPVAFLTPSDAKGLEFDAAIVVEPGRLLREIERGAAALYVAMTRPTQRLHLVTTGELPAGL